MQNSFLFLGLAVFVVGLGSALVRSNPFSILLSLILSLNGLSLAFAEAGLLLGQSTQAMSLFILLVSSIFLCVCLSQMLMSYRSGETPILNHGEDDSKNE